jgi:hypothetical protein
VLGLRTVKWTLPDWLQEYAQGRDHHIPDLTDRMKLAIDLAAQNGHEQLLFAPLRRRVLVLTVAPERRETDHEERRQQACAAD